MVADGAHLAGEADLPMLEPDKLGWQQYPVLVGEELAEQCWRSDMIVSVDTPIDLAAICLQVVENINAYIRGEAINRIDSRGLPGGITVRPRLIPSRAVVQ